MKRFEIETGNRAEYGAYRNIVESVEPGTEFIFRGSVRALYNAARMQGLSMTTSVREHGDNPDAHLRVVNLTRKAKVKAAKPEKATKPAKAPKAPKAPKVAKPKPAKKAKPDKPAKPAKKIRK